MARAAWPRPRTDGITRDWRRGVRAWLRARGAV